MRYSPSFGYTLFAFRIQSSLIIKGFILFAFMQISSLKCTSDLNICSKRKKQTKFSGKKNMMAR